ncbi:hypothetical protein [Desulfospira joergensenii]|uniref:hypothetical protein n=1 Tax=Desulfospira joergensenii TaxID=53329 RepID=UPI0003B44D66|nr:hypothetical protein [Desulfospira joergensenii]
MNTRFNGEVKRETRLYVADISHPASKIFPLLCPTREYEWIEGWECDLLYSESGLAEQDCIFQCRILNGNLPEMWILDLYQPDEKIQFSIHMDGCIIRYTITLFEKPDKTTVSTWHMTLTAFNEAGHRFLAENDPEVFKAKFSVFEAMLNHYLETGEKLTFTDLNK